MNKLTKGSAFLEAKVVKTGRTYSHLSDEPIDGGASTKSPSLMLEGRARDTLNNNIAKEVG